MIEPTMEDAARALREAFEADEVRVDGEPVSREWFVDRETCERREREHRAAREEPRIEMAQEEAEYREFATMLGIEDDEPPERMVEVPVAQYQKWLRDKKILDDLMTTRDAVSPEEEAEYQAFLSLIGPV